MQSKLDDIFCVCIINFRLFSFAYLKGIGQNNLITHSYILEKHFENFSMRSKCFIMIAEIFFHYVFLEKPFLHLFFNKYGPVLVRPGSQAWAQVKYFETLIID